MACGEMLAFQTDEVKYKMGIHTGPIVAGVIGKKLPRYRLFGDTINSAARMMQKGEVGMLQFGEETYKYVPDSIRGQVTGPRSVEMKGKGKVQAYNYAPHESNTNVGERGELFATAPTHKKMNLCQKMNLKDEDTGIIDETARKERAGLDSIFEKALKDADAHDKDSSCLLLSEKRGMTPDKEEAWAKWFQDQIICKKIKKRFGKEAMLLLVLSAFEQWYMFMSKVWEYEHAFYGRELRLPVFVYARGTILGTLVLWWYIAEDDERLKKSAHTQLALLLSYCFLVVVMFISYDAFIYSDTQEWRGESASFCAPNDQIFTLLFATWFFIMTREHALRFIPSLVFVFLAVLLMEIHDVHYLFTKDGKWESLFSFQGKTLFIIQALLNSMVAHEEEQSSLAKWKALDNIRDTEQRTEYILSTLMPPLVVEEISRGGCGGIASHTYRHCTIGQSDLCGFTALSSTAKPQEVVKFMGDLFGEFDTLTDEFKVYKVETIGDAYIAGCAERPLTKTYNPVNVVLFGLAMVRAVDEWAAKLGVKVTCRVGIHHGECIGGIVGEDMQRYHLFGDLMLQMDTLEATSIEGRVQVSAACKKEVERQLRHDREKRVKYKEDISFEEREGENLKTSKGEVHTFEEVGGRTFIVDSNMPLRGPGLSSPT